MKAFDTDILTEILGGNPAYAERIANVPLDEQSAPIIAIEEILRGQSKPLRLVKMPATHCNGDHKEKGTRITRTQRKATLGRKPAATQLPKSYGLRSPASLTARLRTRLPGGSGTSKGHDACEIVCTGRQSSAGIVRSIDGSWRRGQGPHANAACLDHGKLSCPMGS